MYGRSSANYRLCSAALLNCKSSVDKTANVRDILHFSSSSEMADVETNAGCFL